MVKGQSINLDHLNNLKQGADLKSTLVQETFSPTSTIIPVVNESKPVFFDTHQNFDHHETVDESLSIADKDKELIEKALKKHRNKRKDAAADLGISERTLYRKIKEYNLE
jgi:transcriptional regulator with PAS, ATPase and Fis domain